jgi:tetrahydromethanopterin S-methyltransferase subunit B
MIARVTTVLLLMVLALCPSLAVAQGVTTASINGTVTDTNGDPLPGASVVAVHTPSGTQYGTATRLDGRYNLPDMRVGGPYTVTVSFVGFRTRTENVPALALSQDLTLDFTLQDDAQTLEEVLVVATKDEVLNADRTGAATNVNTTQIQRLPTLSRAVSDFTRLSPQSTGFNSFGGRNNLYNNLSLDGSVFNNVFGLASEVGGQANAQPISLDAVEEIQVAVAPYDVRQGSFTGAGINVITKAGTNEFKGSAYTYRRNESLISEKVEDVEVTNTSFTQSLIGGSISGPILKNKLFLFANGEFGRRDDPGSTFLASRGGSTGANISGVRAEDLDLV